MPLPLATRREAEALVIAALESDNPESRRIAAEAQLNYRLRESFQRIDEVREIDLNYLTYAEYQIFLDDMRAQGKFFQPDHWGDYQFQQGKALEPILGVRPEDAEAFCKWLTRRRYGSNERYRLPTAEEAQQYLLPKEMIAMWCRDVGEFKLLGLSSDEEEKIKRDLKQLLNVKEPSLTPLNLESDSVEGFDNFVDKSVERIWVTYFAIGLLVVGILYVIQSFAAYLFIMGCFYGVSSMRDGPTTVTVSGIAIVFMWVWVSSRTKYNDTADPFMGAMFFGWVVGCLLVIVVRAIKNSSTFSRDSNTSFEKTLTPLSEELYSKLRLREQILPITDYDYKRDMNTLIHEAQALQNQRRKEYKWLKVVVARKEDNLRAWEGIRLVREYVN
jgi:hypothetical protein